MYDPAMIHYMAGRLQQCKRNTVKGVQCTQIVEMKPGTKVPDCQRHNDQLRRDFGNIHGSYADDYWYTLRKEFNERQQRIQAERSILDSYYDQLDESYSDYTDGTFSKKPVEISAYQVDEACVIQNPAGDLRCKAGDWVITGIQGERYPCDDEIFRETYDAVDGSTYRKKPVQMEAERATEPQTVMTLEGPTQAETGDWIVTGIKGEQWPVKHEIFVQMYEPDDGPDSSQQAPTFEEEYKLIPHLPDGYSWLPNRSRLEAW